MYTVIMVEKYKMRLNPKKRYLQIALNSTLHEAQKIIAQLPKSDRIIVEAGTPLIKRYGEEGIRKIYQWYQAHLSGIPVLARSSATPFGMTGLIPFLIEQAQKQKAATSPSQLKANIPIHPYVVADLKMMDRGETEVQIAQRAGASAAVALGSAPVESLNAFIESCHANQLDSMIDMMNIEYPLAVINQLKIKPDVIILHRGVDEERLNKEKQIPLYEIRRIKSQYPIMISIAGGDTVREAQRAIFNDADIVVVWKSFFQNSNDTVELAKKFLAEIK